MLKELTDLINSKVPSASATLREAQIGDSSITVKAEAIFDVMKFCREGDMPFNCLQVITGTDMGDWIQVSYMMTNFDIENYRNAIIHVRIDDKNDPVLDSIVSIYPSAEYQERECFDMMGVKFNNHPDLRRILCPDDWEGFPLRKDYVVQEVYNGMEVNPPGKMNFEDREFEARQKAISGDQEASAQE